MHTGPDAMCSGELSLEIREYVQRREMALLVIEAMEEGVRVKRRLANKFMTEHNAKGIGGSENVNLLRDHMEKKLGNKILQTSLTEWDNWEDYGRHSEDRVEGIDLTFMILRRVGKEVAEGITTRPGTTEDEQGGRVIRIET